MSNSQRFPQINVWMACILAILVASNATALADTSIFEWLPLAEAAEKADAEDKLLLIVQAPDACTQTVQRCESAVEYLNAAIPDDGLQAFYEFRVVPCFRPTGPIAKRAETHEEKTVTRKRIRQERSTANRQNQQARRSKAANLSNVVTYICTPDQQVLDLIVGFPSPMQLQEHVDWSFELWRSCESLTPDKRRERISMGHRRKLNLAAPHAKSVDFTGRSLSEVIQFSAKLRDQSILQQFALGWNPRDRAPLIARLRIQGDIAAGPSHHVLMAHPLPQLTDIEQVVFEAFTKQAYWSPPIRRDRIAQWFREQVSAEKPVLLVVSRSASQRPVEASADHLLWQPSRRAIQQMLPNFAVLDIEATELACLFADMDLELESDLRNLKLVVFPRGSAVEATEDSDIPASKSVPIFVDEKKRQSQIQRVLAKAMSDE